MKRSRFSSIAVLVIASATLSSCNFNRSSLFFNDMPSMPILNPDGSLARLTLNVEANLQMPDRFYVESALKDIFDVTPDLPEASQLEALIFNQSSFGGGCDVYGVSEAGNGTAATVEFARNACNGGLTENSVSQSNAARFAQTVKACDALVSGSNTFPRLMVKVIPGWVANQPANRPTIERIRRAYQIFDRTGSLPDEVATALLDLAISEANGDEAWRWVLRAFCESPEYLQAW